MKTTWGIIILFITCALSMHGAAVEAGVSSALAQERAAAIDNVRYDLKMILSDDIKEPIRGEVTISFDYRGGIDQWLQIDFKGDSVMRCHIQDVGITPKYVDEHILVPASMLKIGLNRIVIDFISDPMSLNRNPDYLYSLFVPANAHRAFPCFDQPDLKASLKLSLQIPKDWEALSTGAIASTIDYPEYKVVEFAETSPLPTYLMSWVAGDFETSQATDSLRPMTALYRSTDFLKEAQLPEIFEISNEAISWLEDYTGVKCPFEDYRFVMLPGYQFGGMEHPGAIQYKAESMLLEPNATSENIFNRYQLIAHETAHLWFGDLVTMRWFDDVWTKEVFANFMAAKMCQQAFPEIDHDLNFLHAHYPYSVYTDRTDGTHPISQCLENLCNAGLVYGNNIYYKAPIMMRMLERRMGEERLREGLHSYLTKYAWGNSSWDQLIEILDSVAPDVDVKGFSQAWVKEAGMPVIYTQFDKAARRLHVRQEDPTGKGTIWPQSFKVGLLGEDELCEVDVDLYDAAAVVDVPRIRSTDSIHAIIPNSDGMGYGYFSLAGNKDYLKDWNHISSNSGRYGAVLNLTEAWIRGDLEAKEMANTLLTNMAKEENELVALACVDALRQSIIHGNVDESVMAEAYGLAKTPAVRYKCLKNFYNLCKEPQHVEQIYNIWENQDNPLLSQRDYMTIAYRLAILLPDMGDAILEKQSERLSNNADLMREFEFVSRACNRNPAVREKLFKSLEKAENRRPEPWVVAMIGLLCDRARDPQCIGYVKGSLDMLPEVQRTGDIFFPSQWLRAMLGNLGSPEVRELLIEFCRDIESTPLNNKLLEHSYLLRKIK